MTMLAGIDVSQRETMGIRTARPRVWSATTGPNAERSCAVSDPVIDMGAVPGSTRYSTEHHKMRRMYGSARNYLCEGCSGQASHWATIHGRTGLEPMIDRVPLCGRCHIAYDGSGHRTAHTEASRQKMSESQREKNRKAREAGREPMPPETRAKLSAALKGRPKTPEHNAKAAAARRGQKRSPEARQKMSDAWMRRVEALRASGADPLTGNAAQNAAKTHCNSGHEFTPENTYPQTNGGRGCKECHRKTCRDYLARQKATRTPSTGRPDNEQH